MTLEWKILFSPLFFALFSRLSSDAYDFSTLNLMFIRNFYTWCTLVEYSIHVFHTQRYVCMLLLSSLLLFVSIVAAWWCDNTWTFSFFTISPGKLHSTNISINFPLFVLSSIPHLPFVYGIRYTIRYTIYYNCARFHFFLVNNANRKVSLNVHKSEQSAPKPKTLSTTIKNPNNNKYNNAKLSTTSNERTLNCYKVMNRTTKFIIIIKWVWCIFCVILYTQKIWKNKNWGKKKQYVHKVNKVGWIFAFVSSDSIPANTQNVKRWR